MAPRKPTAGRTPALNMALLASVCAATLANSFAYVSVADATPFLGATPPLMEQNASIAEEGTGSLATRATQAGLDMNASQQPAPTNAPPAPVAQDAPKFVFIKVPETKRGGANTGKSKYNFEAMPAPNADGACASFFVAATEEMPEPAKSLASTVSAATRKYATEAGTRKGNKARLGPDNKPLLVDGKKVYDEVDVPNYTYERKFVIRAVADGSDYGFPGQKGAAIIRTV